MPTDAPDIASSMDAEELVDRYGKRVYYLALDLTGDHHDAEDLSQEVLVKACRSLDSFRGASKPFTWLYRIAVNTYLNDYLRYQARSTFQTAALDGAPDAGRR